MKDQAISPTEHAYLGSLTTVAESARDYIHQSKAQNTRRAYHSDWAHFQVWCVQHRRTSLPATEQTLALYFSDLASTHKTSTLQRRVASISQAHQIAGFESPTRGPVIRSVLAGIRRAKGTAPAMKTAVLTEDLFLLIKATSQDLLGCRDRALLLLGFAGAFRRSELVSLDCEDLDFQREGLIVTLRRSKTDPEAHGRKIGIPLGSAKTCPVRAIEEWMKRADITSGPLFRPVNRHGQLSRERLADKTVATVVKRWADSAGLDPGLYAGHSLRAGLATSAARNGASERSIMNQTGHKSHSMVRRYIREGSVFHDNAAGKAGL